MWNIQCDQTLSCNWCYGYEEFHNAGLLLKTAGTGTTSFNVYLDNSGSVQSQNGTIQFNYGSNLGGSFQADTTGAIYFQGGSFNLNGPVNFQGPGPVGIAGGVELNGTLSGTLNWYGASLSAGSALTVATNGVLNLNGANLYGALTNGGTVNWQSGTITVYNNFSGGGAYTGAIWNEAGALWDIQCDQAINCWQCNGSEQFHNAGLLVKSAYAGTTSFNLFLDNSGTVQARSGTIQFSGGGNPAGTFQADTNAAIYFSGGSVTLNTPLSFQGPGPVGIAGSVVLNGILSGTLSCYGASLNPGSALTVASNGVLNIAGGVTLSSALTNEGTVNWQSGTITVYNNFSGGGAYTGAIWNEAGALWDIQCDQAINCWQCNGSEQFHNAGLLVKSAYAGTTSFNVFLDNSGTVQARSGTMQFNQGGTLEGYFETAGTGGFYFGGGAFIGQIAGTVTCFGGTVGAGSSLTVATNGVLNILGGMGLYGVLTNQGTVNWQGGTVTVYNNSPSGYTGEIWNEAAAVWNIQCDQTIQYPSYWGWPLANFHNAGLLLKSAYSGATSFDLFLDNSGTVQAQSGTIQFNEGGNPSGTFQADANGAIYFDGGAVALNGPLNFQGPGPVGIGGGVELNGVLSAALNCYGGSLSPGSALTVATNGVLNLYGANLYGVLTNQGTVNWQGGTITVYNNPSAGYTGEIWNEAGALWDIQCDQAMNYPSWWGYPLPNFHNAGVLRKSAGLGTTYLTANVDNSGALDAETGTMNLNGTYTLETSGNLNFGINGPDDYGQIILPGGAVLAGSLSVNLNQGYAPAVGDSYAILSYNSETGIFAGMALPSSASWGTNYGPAVFTLGVLSALRLAPIPNQIVEEQTLFTATATATDSSGAPGPLAFSLDSAPTGMAINPGTGVITWTPSLAQNLSTNTIVVRVTDQSTPPLSATTSFTLVVLTEVPNQTPVLSPVGPQTVNILAQLTVTNAAVEADGYATVSYALLNPPAGAVVGTNGVITWTPDQNQGPGTTIITTVATSTDPYDTANPQLSATNQFTVEVRVVNLAPVLPVLYPRTVAELALLTVTNTATALDPRASLSYQLLNPPAGAVIDTNGIITWTSSQAESPSTNRIAAVATSTDLQDAANPVMSATNWLTVIVREVNAAPLPPVTGTQLVNELTLLTVTNTATDSNIHSTLGYTLVSAPAGAAIDAHGVITWTPAQSQSPSTNVITTVITSTNVLDLFEPFLRATNSFTVIVREVNQAPLLAVLPPQTLNELTLLTVTNTAAEANVHSTLTYSLANPPVGAAIDGNGVIMWTPAQTQSPGTYVITTVVTNSNPYDQVNPSLSATNTFTVVVKEVNVAPVLPAIGPQTISELTLLTVTNTATEANIHSTLGYLLVNPPSGVGISASGIITWTPTPAQSPSTNVITTVVTNSNPYDLANPSLSATNSFTIVVKEANVAPVLSVISTQTVNELTLMTVTNTATEANLRARLGYLLLNPPAGAVIDTNGIITWTPAQTQSPSTNLITTVVTNSDPFDLVNPSLSATNSFTVIVKEVNVAPVLPVVPPQSVNELTFLTVTDTATESNIHSTLGYILANAPAGASISAGGVITWTPAQTQSPGTYVITTVVTNSNPYDLANPSLSATNSFTVIVNEVNLAPVLPGIGPQTLNELTLLTVTNTAAEANMHSTLGYLLVNPPSGVGISASGIITWTPTQAQSPSTNVITTVVINSNPYDLVNPSLSATNSFTVVVREANLPPVLSVISTKTVNELTLLTVTNTATEANLHARLGYLLLNPPAGAVIDGSGILTWTPAQTQSPSTNVITTVVTNSDPFDLVNPSLSATNSFTVMVREVNVAPVLPVVPPQSVNELTLLTVTNTAAESNIHSTLGYILAGAPAGASISADGIITWTPAQTQSPGTYVITTVVTNSNPYDLANPHLSATNTFTVVVNEINVAPVLPLIPPQSVNELTLLTVTNTATESDIHATLTYVLDNSPAGMSIDTNGIITWVPSQAQSPSTNIVTTFVINSDPSAVNVQQMVAANSFTVIVKEVNTVPILPVIGSQNVNELTLLTVTNTATESNIHSTLGYTLLTAPSGASISANGIIAWTPAQTQSPSTNLITTVVTNSNPFDLANPHLNATNTFTVVVKEVNVAPVLPTIGVQTVNELTLFTVTNTATEPNPHSSLGYLLVNAPSGASISANGIITWTPAQAQSPSTNVITTVATNTNPYDLVNPSLSATNSFTVVVREVNLAPVLSVISTQTVNELTLLTVTNAATESNTYASLGYLLVSAPPGASISTNGTITWTPAQTQSPSTNLITTVVTSSDPFDLINPSLSATNSFTVIVKEVNVAPVLPVIALQSVNELTLLTVTNTATESNIHSALGYWLANAPSGASISAGGVITWTPAQTQSPGTYVITTVVTNSNLYDQANPHLSATNSFTVVVNEVNVAPVLPIIPPQSVNELTLLTVTNTATESDIHATLAYVLDDPPAGMSIDTNGVITWIPSQSQSPSTNIVTTFVINSDPSAGNAQQLVAVNSFTVIVKEVNVAPVLPVITTQTVYASALLTVTNTATESNIHSALGYVLVSPPSGVGIDTNGIITWTPTLAQSPGTNLITVVVTNYNPYDMASPYLSATNSFTVIVLPPAAPTLVIGAIANRTANAGQTVTVTNSASGGNGALTYSLLAAPAGAAVNPVTGVFTWRPRVSSAGSSNYVQVGVADSGSPPEIAVQAFALLVNPLAPVRLTPLPVRNGSLTINLTGSAGPDYIIQGSTDFVNWANLSTNTPAAMPFSITDTNASAIRLRFYRALLGP